MPSSPWHATQQRPYKSLPAATFGSPEGITRSAEGGGVCPGIRGGGALIGIDSILPASENNQTLSPRLPVPNSVPADITAMYWRPLCSNVLAVAFTPASVRNSHTLCPFVLSSAMKRPSLRPTNTSPPAVLIEPLKHCSGQAWFHTRRFVFRSYAPNTPRRATCGNGSGP